MYHWDLPQALQDVNGWQNPTIVQAFENYADLLYSRFGDRVTRWITFNEPWVTCVMGHGSGVHAPGIIEPATAPYLCAHNLLKSHGTAYRLYERTYKTSQGGSVGITLDSAFYSPLDPNNDEDVAAAERAVLFKVKYTFAMTKGRKLKVFHSMAGLRIPSSEEITLQSCDN